MARLPRRFYARPTLEVAPDLLGKVLVHRTPSGLTSGIIVEVEAYVGESDPACHAAPGPTKRNAPMYGLPGHAYVYLNYGVHYLVNIVTEPKASPAAVLIRALEPLDGIALMRRRRMRSRTVRHRRSGASIRDHWLCKGPGNVTRAMGIRLADTNVDLLGDKLFIEDRGHRVEEISWSPRIGISVGTERLWRCYAKGNAAVSGKRM
ncbi:MAG TPA: DNA-3-methyladenine glycosylase [Vicinamibacterales bacterium]|nr:DNA-3-methyladenine glycosylase [Vicinamibacterales bacterium]